jgi:hypothetical protein
VDNTAIGINGVIVGLACVVGVSKAQDCNSAVDNIPPGYTFNDLIYEGWGNDPPAEIKIEEVVEDEVKEGWATNQAWACGVFGVGTVTPPPNVPRIWHKNWNWCVEIGGDAAYKPKVDLAVGLQEVLGVVGSLGAEFGLNGDYKYCETTDFTVQYAPAQSQCWHTYARIVWVNASVHGTVTAPTSRFYWRPKQPPGAAQIVVDCGVSTSEGTAKEKRANIVQQAPKTPNCAVFPGTPLQDPDPWDGKHVEPCCHPVPWCDEKAVPACCALVGGN